ncbi:hypothetical protein RHEC894_PC00430 (plasmid) [Rhizobium sp. CIAT894]|nr:hypothetical protein RHEC894_PC00430 [Rhizobium sp. CIAT894]PDT04110.1 hypothetical protein CO655_33180 [Rhizobium sp. M1]
MESGVAVLAASASVSCALVLTLTVSLRETLRAIAVPSLHRPSLIRTAASADQAWDTNGTICGDPIAGHLPWQPDKFIAEGDETAIATSRF